MTKASTNLVAILAGVVSALAAAGCQGLPGAFTPIAEVLKDPGRYSGKEARVQGKVTSALKLPLVDTATYTLRDETGEIMVVCKCIPPAVESSVRVAGTVDTVAVVGTTTVGVHLKENRRW